MNIVGDAVRGQAKVVRMHHAVENADLAALDHVPQPAANVVPAVSQARDRTAQQGVGRTAAPLGHLRLRRFVDDIRGVDAAEEPAAFEVGANDGRQLLGGLVFVAEFGDGDGHLHRADA